MRLSSKIAAGSLALCLCLPGLADAGEALPGSFPNGVAAGDVTMTSAVLWAHTTSVGKLAFEVATDSDLNDLVATLEVSVVDPAAPGKVEITGLVPGTRYYYRATNSSFAQVVGSFRTLPEPESSGGVRFGVTGDWRQELAPYPSIRNAAERDLDFFVELGDTIYADFPSPDVPLAQAETLGDFRAKHKEGYGTHFGLNTWASLRASTAIFASIDDHEVTNDFAGGAPPYTDPRFLGAPGEFINETPLYNTGLQAFHEYNPILEETWPAELEPRMAGKPRLYRSRTFGSDAAIFLLDARSFRDTELPPVTNPLDPLAVFQFLAGAFDPSRTLLGRPQLDQLKADLLAAHLSGVTWKFILIPEPIQNLGPVAASDRYEGYAAERAELLAFIDRAFITNVVFVSADLHGTLVNNLSYQVDPRLGQLSTPSFEVITGAVAFDAPFGPTVIGIASQVGLISPLERAFYETLPRDAKDDFFTAVVDAQLVLLGYDRLGLDGSPIPAQLVQGGYVRTHTYGWTELEVEEGSQRLRITTYGIDAYTENDLVGDSPAPLAAVPEVVSEVTVEPVRLCVPSPTRLCLGRGRFAVEAAWEDFTGGSGEGSVFPLNGVDFGGFYFFNGDNPELLVKLVDGRIVNAHRWVFLGGLTNVGWTVTVTDLQTGDVSVYENEVGAFTSLGDASAFQQHLSIPPAPPLPARVPPSSMRVPEAPGVRAQPAPAIEALQVPTVAAGGAGCVPSDTRLCLLGGRFEAELTWSTGTPAPGFGVSTADGAGYFWFFSPDNPEVFFKVLDGRVVNGNFWVFAAGLTSIDHTLTIRDTTTNEVLSLEAPGGFESVANTAAFQ